MSPELEKDGCCLIFQKGLSWRAYAGSLGC